ncbi:MAG: glycosyltransferase [Bdellovibrionales bacterium]|nr:glycosyltransferase [Bdellovibrionales bacterium]
MKVLLFIETGGPGGAERVVSMLAQALPLRHIETDVLTFRTGWLTEQLQRQHTRHIRIATARRFDIALPFRIARVLRSGAYDVLHSHLLDSNFYGALAAKIAGVPHVATEHGDVHHIEGKNFARLKVRSVGLLGSFVTAVSRHTLEKLFDFGIPPERAQVVGNPIAFAAADAEVRTAKRRELQISSTTWVWLHAANLRPVKDQATLLRGFAHSLKSLRRSPSDRTIDPLLLIAGDGKGRGALEELAVELGIAERVHFLGFRQDIPELIAAADGFVLSSLSEAMPMSLLEAASAGLVVAASSVGGIPEVVRDGDSGFLFPAGDWKALGTILSKATHDREQASVMSRRLQQWVHSNCSVDAVVEQYATLYNRLCSEHPGSKG